jgi:catechol 2,3-dioxygenase-like lactoylglutathione lyase family enzyme
MSVRLEHANLSVRNVDAMTQFLRAAFPDFRIRSSGQMFGRRWVHVGTDDTYVALTEAPIEPAEPWVPYAGRPGTNHLGYEVDDVESLRQRLSAAGYRDSTVPNAHPHRQRVYFHDAEGNDWEFVEYHSQDPEERNDYDHAD